MNECMMGCDPPPGGGGERFYTVVMEELTIYAHTTDAHTQAKYPTDWPHTLEGRERGIEFACWHSKWCPDGELSTGEMASLRPITYEQFIEARDNNWPELLDSPISREGPVMAVGYVDEQGGAHVTWDSLHGDAGA